MGIGEFENSIFSKKKYKFFLDAPFDISDVCCRMMKKQPTHQYAKRTGKMGIIGTMASESRLRTANWLKTGCNAFDAKTPTSKPMSFWTENDVLEYIVKNNLKICSVYGEVIEADDQISFDDLGFDCGEKKKYKTTGAKRTGCMLCGFGAHLEKSPNRFELLKELHPGMYDQLDKITNNGITFREAIEWTNEHGNLNIKL